MPMNSTTKHYAPSKVFYKKSQTIYKINIYMLSGSYDRIAINISIHCQMLVPHYTHKQFHFAFFSTREQPELTF